MRLGQAETGRPGERLRALLAAQNPLVVPGCCNALSALILEDAGLGRPDAGLARLTEMTLNADGDTGHGKAVNMMRCVQEFSRSGVAGIHLEEADDGRGADDGGWKLWRMT